MKEVFKWIFGIDRFVLSYQEYKRVLLTSQLNLIFIGALLVFTGIDLISGYYYPVAFNAFGIFCGLIVIWLNRNGFFLAAKVTLAFCVNVIAIFFTFILLRDLGIFIFSICINIGVFVAFGYERVRIAWLIVIVSTIGFLVAMFYPHERLAIDEELSDYIEKNLIASYLIASAASVVIIYYLLKANYKVEASLSKKEVTIESRNQELQKVNDELDRFFYSASHDMRAPLTSILGLIHLMELSNDLNEIKDYASMLKGRAENLDQFIKSISEYSSNSRQELKFQQIALRNCLRENLENIKFYPRVADIKIILDVSAELIIVSDPIRLQIIFGNLLSNAVKYHDFKKTDPFIKIKAEAKSEEIKVWIEDNGLGMGEENLNNIFKMFFRAHNHAEGTGLGLYIVKETIQKLGGSIDVKSVLGQGSTFVLTLPSKTIVMPIQQEEVQL